ncbi:hypothetical protein RA086_04050 [Lactiplantibacillus sp. WILCCON 0030]|uniref:Uncharacterized protein n=1 Tax=Lactiplantibacillus brownii TaxID=3069269 RepID=A0ABU1A7C1_9LACO|nr:hypothetical protein [Lactiplantibacillus brownii]MDQ7936819.1 hypothetical protein [Lactiplantibacillus brownii]
MSKPKFELASDYINGPALGAAVEKIKDDPSNGLSVRYATRNNDEIKFIFTAIKTGKVTEMAYQKSANAHWVFNAAESTPLSN